MARSREPSVLVLLVATDGATWLPEVIRGLRAQSYPSFEIIAVDNACEDNSRALLRKAFGAKRVIRLERRVPYGRALASALKTVVDLGIEADAFLLLHDDCVVDADAVQKMVELLEGESVGIVAPKLVEWSDAAVLQHVGGATDRYGRIFPRLERGELDHGQHDAPHESLYVSSACMLVTRGVVERVGLFDLRYVALRDDYDLCWRARIAGFRTVVCGTARARHALAGYRQLREGPVRGRVRYFSERNMIATMIKNYRVPRLLLSLPVTLAVSIASALVFIATGRRRAGLQTLEALQWNVAHLGGTLRLRFRAQRARRWPDSEVTALMESGASRIRGYVERAFDRIAGEVPSDDEEGPPASRPSIAERLRAHPAAVLGLIAAAVWLIGARRILGGAPLAGADMGPFPGRSADLFGEFFSGRRTGGTGSAGPASPGLFLLGMLQWLAFGSAWLAQRALVLGLPLVAGATAWRLAGALGLRGAHRRATGIAYALSPLALGAFGDGRLADMILLAAAPGLLTPIVRAAGLAPERGWRSLAFGTLGLAATSSLVPWAIPFTLGASVAIALGAAVAGASRTGVAAVRRALVLDLGALALLFPWSIELFRPGSAFGIGGEAPAARMADLIALSPGPVRPVPRALAYGFPVAALLGVAIAVPSRRVLSRALAVAAAVSLLLSWAVARGVGWIAPRPAQPLALAAVAMVILAGIAWEGVRPHLARRAFGARHLALAAVAIAFFVEAGAGGTWIARGLRPGIEDASSLRPAFMVAEQASRGAFRVVWLDGSSKTARVALTPAEGETMRSWGARAAGPGWDALLGVVAGLASGADPSAARQLGAFGVRYVVLRPGADASLADALERQADLRFSQRFRGARIYENRAGVPISASVSAQEWASASRRGLSALSAAGPSARAGKGFRMLAPGHLTGRASAGSRAVLLAEEFGTGWRAHAGGRAFTPRRSFGWATAFDVRTPGAVDISWSGQAWHRLALLGELALLVGFAVAWSQRAARERGER